jgi:molybdopterin synthase catalytic subunit
MVTLVDERLELTQWQSYLADPDVGAHAWFVGVTRRMTDGKQTASLSYEAHRKFAERELQQLARCAIVKFGLTRVILVHRLGVVPIGEASVIVGCSSPHRTAVFAALPWIMDELKRIVPIWKQEQYVDGTTQWIHPAVDPSKASNMDSNKP